MNIQADHHHVWGIILAGGNGNRVQQFTLRLCGEPRPKQYCAFTGSRSMLRHTIDRVEQIIPSKRIVTIVNHDHLVYLRGQMNDQPCDNIIIQPQNRDTGPGILYPLLKVWKRDPEAIIAIFPSDHFIREEARFRDYVRVAISSAALHTDTLVILGAIPDEPEQAYGWIQTGDMIDRHLDKSLYKVSGFWEKPTIETARTLYTEGSVWNTFIFVGRADMLLRKFKHLLPTMYRSFDNIFTKLDSLHERNAIGNVFAHLPSVNFSRAILERIPQHMGVIPMEQVYWSDWGDESRIISDCKRFGLTLRGSRRENHINAEREYRPPATMFMHEAASCE